jgi:hypothetical protein
MACTREQTVFWSLPPDEQDGCLQFAIGLAELASLLKAEGDAAPD